MCEQIKKFDASYKRLFSHKEVVASLLQCFAPPEILEKMRLNTLHAMPTEHITEKNRARINDSIWRLEFGDSTCYLVIMFEFQRVEDIWMALRKLIYSGLFFDDLTKQEGQDKRFYLPAILPIVLYNGEKAWTAPTSMEQLYSPNYGELEKYCPSQEFFLIDIKHLSQENDRDKNSLCMAIFDLERAKTPEDIIIVFENLSRLMPADKLLSLHKAFINLLASSIANKSPFSKELRSCQNVQEAYQMLSQTLETWENNVLNKGIAIGRNEGISIGRNAGKEEGIKIGSQNAIKQFIYNIIKKRLNQLPEDIVKKIDAITEERILNEIALDMADANSFGDFESIINQSQK